MSSLDKLPQPCIPTFTIPVVECSDESVREDESIARGSGFGYCTKCEKSFNPFGRGEPIRGVYLHAGPDFLDERVGTVVVRCPLCGFLQWNHCTSGLLGVIRRHNKRAMR